MVYNNRMIGNIGKITGTQAPQTRPVQSETQGSFEKIFQDKINESKELKFSKHAEARLQSRNIKLTGTQLQKINQAVDKAQQKGVKDSLVLVDNLAFVVNVKSRTVITAVNNEELKENVFTNIDGAVIA